MKLDIIIGKDWLRERTETLHSAAFGDERIDYEEALKNYYQSGAPANGWILNQCLCKFTSMGGLGRILGALYDIIDNGNGLFFWLSVDPWFRLIRRLKADIQNRSYHINDFENHHQLLAAGWLFAINSLNRSMGLNEPILRYFKPVKKNEIYTSGDSVAFLVLYNRETWMGNRQ